MTAQDTSCKTVSHVNKFSFALSRHPLAQRQREIIKARHKMKKIKYIPRHWNFKGILLFRPFHCLFFLCMKHYCPLSVLITVNSVLLLFSEIKTMALPYAVSKNVILRKFSSTFISIKWCSEQDNVISFFSFSHNKVLQNAATSWKKLLWSFLFHFNKLFEFLSVQNSPTP